MEVQKSIKARKPKRPLHTEDPENLTHYLGNDDYRHGNRVMEPTQIEPDGFSAQGNELLDEFEDNESDLSDFVTDLKH